ncbi:hypothetical protein SAMN05216268_1551 [Streptomyces yunnanensis]|uniref:Uncharacterized protein n=1 Tax=Streptomyces yunnanensis TaxID=156453 RepID=A0A9X8N9S4_9ACTN|nr:hypothetical protein SAMN05216268_1551 [Streptomyces yunnanensis]
MIHQCLTGTGRPKMSYGTASTLQPEFSGEYLELSLVGTSAAQRLWGDDQQQGKQQGRNLPMGMGQEACMAKSTSSAS